MGGFGSASTNLRIVMTKPSGKVSAEMVRANFFVALVTHRMNPSKTAVHRNTVGIRERDKTSTSERRGAERPCYLVFEPPSEKKQRNPHWEKQRLRPCLTCLLVVCNPPVVFDPP